MKQIKEFELEVGDSLFYIHKQKLSSMQST